MAYPPPDHYLSDLGFRPTLEAAASRVLFEVTPALCGPDGGVLLGVLATAIDMAAGGLSRRQAEPELLSHRDLAIDLAAPIPAGPCRVDCRLARRGRTLVTLELDLRAGHHEAAPRHGLATAAFAVLPDPGREQGSGSRGDGRESGADSPAGSRVESPPESRTPSLAAAGTASPQTTVSRRAGLPLADRIGMRRLDPSSGAVEIDLDDYVRNTFGALQGGVVAVLGEAAILAATGRSLVALAVRYRTLGRIGPFRTTVELTPGALGVIARVVLCDHGAQGGVVAVITGRTASL